MKIKMFFMVRHGERADHVKDREETKKIQDKDDPPLTSKGFAQAKACGHRISELACPNVDTIIYSSPFLR